MGCYVSLKLRNVSLKLRNMRGPGGICNGIINLIYRIPLFLTLLSFICSSPPEQLRFDTPVAGDDQPMMITTNFE